MSKFLAIIPARKGSKRLPNKNILNLAGKPLIYWTIDAALNSNYISKIVVSSDSDKILQLSNELGVDTLKRPEELALDNSLTVDVVKHVIHFYPNYEYIVLLQPTSPLRQSRHINQAIELLLVRKADAVISVCEVEHSPLWCNILPSDLNLKNFLQNEIKNKKSQDLPKYYRINGAIYICNTKKFLEQNTFFIEDNIFAYIMEQEFSIDIDNEIDFILAEILLKKYRFQYNYLI